MLLEAIASGVVTVTYYTIAISSRSRLKVQGFVMGGVVFCLTMSLARTTGAAINPVRLIGGAIISKKFFFVLPYLLG